ncbi:MAG: M28 family metallopeptidase [Actinomycetota bacterium]
MPSRFTRLLAVSLAGALVVPAFIAGGATVATGKPVNPNRFYDLSKAPKPNVTGKEIMAGLQEYVDRFPMRHNGLPNNQAAAEFLAKESKRYGFKTRILELEVGQQGAVPRTVRVVEAVKKGTTKPDEWIAFIAHYDLVAPDGAGFTVQGAYDDGSGTNILRYFGRAFSKVRTNRSIALLWFDAEENGLLASRAYAEMLKEKGQKVHAGLGFDMVGIGHPARYCICIYHGPTPEDAELAVPISRYVNFDFLKFPEGDGGRTAAEKWPLGTDGHICVCGPNIRNSDERNFAAQGWFTMRWTGMRTATDYPGYHQPWDTIPFMEAVAGGRENLEQGIENTFKSAWYTTFVLDNL